MEQANSVDSYLEILAYYQKGNDFYYRGQLEKYTDISPSIARNPGYAVNESKIYQEAVSLGSVDLEGLASPLERLSKLQHYGIPTRLVDVTIDPLIALYFAVENVADYSAGNVYCYQAEGYPADSKEVKVLSLLPTTDNLTKNNIANEFEKQFGESISDEDIFRIVNSPVILQHSEFLQKSNPRLHRQRGTFLICGNVVDGNTITSSLKSLDTYTPTLVIRVPFEYKKAIKDDLDSKYNINRPSVYPELPSVATYIKEKYKEENISLDGTYSIVNVENTLAGTAKRVSVTIVLNKQLTIDQIKRISIDVMQNYQKSKDIIWLLVACTGDDYITSNWFLRCQWISPEVDPRFRPMTLRIKEDGYYWDYSKSYSIMADFFTEKSFDDDRALYVKHKMIWEQFIPMYTHLQESFNNYPWDVFGTEVLNQKDAIRSLYRQLQDIGISHDKDFDDFLSSISVPIGLVDDFRFLIEKRESYQMKNYQVKRKFEEASVKIKQIDQGFSKWQAKGETIE